MTNVTNDVGITQAGADKAWGTTVRSLTDKLDFSLLTSQIDAIGTVSQGVVSYNVQITFDTQDSRIKPGMSASVNIITNTQQNVLTVPNSAVKTKKGTS